MKFTPIALLLLAISLAIYPQVSRAVLIDTFVDGTIPNTSSPPFRFFIQTGLTGAIGNQRQITWTRNEPSTSGTLDVDLNSTVPGSLLLRSTASPIGGGIWDIAWGLDHALDADITDGGQSDAYAIRFSYASAGTIFFGASDMFGNVQDSIAIPIPAMPTGGWLVIPFSEAFPVLTVDITHSYAVVMDILADDLNLQFNIESVQTVNAEFVPEPSSFAIAASGLGGLVACMWRRRRALASS